MTTHWMLMKVGTSAKCRHGEYEYSYINKPLRIYSGHRTCTICGAIYGWIDRKDLALGRGFLKRSVKFGVLTETEFEKWVFKKGRGWTF